MRSAAPEAASSSASAEPVLALEIRLANGETHQRRVYAESDGGYLLETGAGPLRYELSAYDLDGLLELDPDRLVAEPADGPSDTATAAEGVNPKVPSQAAASSEAPTTDDGDALTGVSTEQETAEVEPTAVGPAETAAEAETKAAAASPPSPTDEPERTVADSQLAEGSAAAGSEPEQEPEPELEPEQDSKPEAKSEPGPAATSAAESEPTQAVEQQPARAPARGAPAPWPYPRYAPQTRPPWPPQGRPQGAPPQAPPGWR